MGPMENADRTERYFESLYPPDADLDRVLASIEDAGMPAISVAPGYGRLLTLLAGLAGTRSALEIGALGGYSGICIARGLPIGGRLTSLELRPDYAELASRNMAAAGYGAVGEWIVGEALHGLERLAAEGRTFGFVFIDADKENYPHYLQWAMRLAEPGAIVAADNTLLHGRTLDDGKQGPAVQAMRRFNETIARHPHLTGVHLPAYDGLAIARINRQP